MNKRILVVCTVLTVLVGLLIAVHVLSRKSSTVEKDFKSSELPTLPTIDTSANYCDTPACVIASSKLHVNYNKLVYKPQLIF